MTTDWRTLLGEAAWLDPDGYDVHLLLATKVPDLCPDCEGSGYTKKRFLRGVVDDWDCDHPNAPTIGRLLAIGEAVWTARDTTLYAELASGHIFASAAPLLAALKAVE